LVVYDITQAIKPKKEASLINRTNLYRLEHTLFLYDPLITIRSVVKQRRKLKFLKHYTSFSEGNWINRFKIVSSRGSLCSG